MDRVLTGYLTAQRKATSKKGMSALGVAFNNINYDICELLSNQRIDYKNEGHIKGIFRVQSDLYLVIVTILRLRSITVQTSWEGNGCPDDPLPLPGNVVTAYV